MFTEYSIVNNEYYSGTSSNTKRSTMRVKSNFISPTRSQPQHDDHYRDSKSPISPWDEWSITRNRSKHNLEDTIEIDPIIERHMTIPLFKASAVPPQKLQKDVRLASLSKKKNTSVGTQSDVHQNMLIVQNQRQRLQQQQQQQQQQQKQQHFDYDALSHEQRRVTKSRRLNHHFSDNSTVAICGICTGAGKRHFCDSSSAFWDHLYTLTGNVQMKTYKLTH
jgi:hypothetical protein